MADSKTYLPEEITTEPFPAPGDELVNAGSATVAAGKEDQQLSPATTGVNKKFPERVIAHQTISESLNTKEKKILGNYQFGPQGAIQVGKYVSGTSGDIKITPDGVTARNSTGDTTFVLDGTTGDVTIKGTLESESVITGNITVETASSIAFEVGSDIILTADDSNPCEIIFRQSALDTEYISFKMKDILNALYIVPNTDSSNHLGIGIPTTQRFSTIGLFAATSVDISAGNGTYIVSADADIFNGIMIKGNVYPQTDSTYNLGNGTYYWNDVSYKTLTDRGCFGWFDDGVKLRDGRTVSDVEALKEIKKHPFKKTVYGSPRLDYKSMPEAVYKEPIVKKDEKLIYDEERDQFYIEYKDKKTKKVAKVRTEEGAELSALVSIMLGAIKELDTRISKLEI